jgi:hypothetical protein
MPEDSYHHGETYDHCMSALRKKAGLTYREARAYLMPNWERPEVLAEEWGITTEALYDIVHSAEMKIQRSGLTLDEIYGDNKIRLMFVDP